MAGVDEPIRPDPAQLRRRGTRGTRKPGEEKPIRPNPAQLRRRGTRATRKPGEETCPHQPFSAARSSWYVVTAGHHLNRICSLAFQHTLQTKSGPSLLSTAPATNAEASAAASGIEKHAAGETKGTATIHHATTRHY